MSDKSYIKDYLIKIDDCINQGEFKDNWTSLSTYGEPQWYKNAKFGIFIHWGVYSVPSFGNEWYPRNMYQKGSKEYKHHIKTYGPHKDFAYKDFIPLFKGEKFNPDEWADLFKASGAKYVMPVAEHHDGFQMYRSEVSHWNAAEMGPKRDVLGELKEAFEKRDMVFTASSHRAENFCFFGGGRFFDSGIDKIEFEEPYGFASDINEKSSLLHSQTNDIYGAPPNQEHLDEWLVGTCELVDKYQPKVFWFDWWTQNRGFKAHFKRLAA